MKFKMNNIEFEIVELNQVKYKEFRKKEDEENGCEISNTLAGEYLGSTHHKTCKIYLDESMAKDRKKRTLLHELGHCYINEYITHENKNYDEEMVADIIANSHDIIHEIVEKYFK